MAKKTWITFPSNDFGIYTWQGPTSTVPFDIQRTFISPPSTVYRWMARLGFRYATRKKGYYVHGHEKPAMIQYQWDFCKWSYLGYEERMHRWTQQRAAEEAVSWKRRWDNKGLKLQESESSVLGFAPRIFTVGFLWRRGKRVKRTSALWCKRLACQQTKC